MEEDFWEILERPAAIITIFQAMPKVKNFISRLHDQLKKRFRKSKRKLK